jgi:hypothetical protein
MEGDTLKDVGGHAVYSTGHYEAILGADGSVTILTLFADPKQTRKVILSSVEWDRLVAWVEWQRKDENLRTFDTTA